MIVTPYRFRKAPLATEMFPSTRKGKTGRFQVPPGFKSVFENLRSRDGLRWTVGLTVEITRVFKFFFRSFDVN